MRGATMRLLPENEAKDFLSLYLRLLHFAGSKRGVIPKNATFQKFMNTSLETKLSCRDAVYAPSLLIQEFMDSQEGLSEQEKLDAKGFERFIAGSFVAFKHTKNHTIFLPLKDAQIAYAVNSLTSDLGEMLDTPVVINTVLLPFRGKILCDGLIKIGTFIGRNMQASINDEYKKLKKAGKLLTEI
jgi:hypothetical protein